MIKVAIIEAGEDLFFSGLKDYDIVVRGDVVVKDRHLNAAELLHKASLAKTLGQLIEESKPENPSYGRIGR